MKYSGKEFVMPIKYLCLEGRDSVLFWLYLVAKNDIREARQFGRNHSNSKIRNRGEHIFNKIKRIKDSISLNGQTNPIPVICIGNKLYPLDGTKRIVALFLLKESNIKIQVVEWVKDYSVTGPFFDGVDLSLKKRFMKWRKNFYDKQRIAKTDLPITAFCRALLPLSSIQKNKSKRTKTCRR